MRRGGQLSWHGLPSMCLLAQGTMSKVDASSFSSHGFFCDLHSFYKAIVIIVMKCDIACAAQGTMRLTVGS